MDDEKLAFLDGEAAPIPDDGLTAAAEQPAEETAGTGEPEQPASPPEAPKSEAGMVPIAAMLDEREKRQRLERDLAELQRQQQANAARAQIPDPAEDPRAFAAHQHAQTQHALWNERLNMSETMAISSFGSEVVSAAQEAFAAEVQRNPALYADFQRQTNPYAFVVSWHKRQMALTEYGDDPAAYRARIEAEIRQQLAAAAPPQTPAPVVPPSMASAPAAGGQKAQPGSMFDQIF